MKIGRTNNLEERMRALWSSGAIPAEFACYYAGRVDDMEQVERTLHEIFGDKRVHPRREFFTADPHRVAMVIRMLATEEIVDSTQPEAEDVVARQRVDDRLLRRERFNFAMLDIVEGDELSFVGREEIKCTVVSQQPARVEYDGRSMSLSEAATKLLGKSYGVNGTLYWQYGAETIWERRERLGDVAYPG